MATKAKFKERTYEKYFGYELIRQNNSTFPFSPDLLAEYLLGYDEAIYIPIRWENVLLYRQLLGGIWNIPGGIQNVVAFDKAFQEYERSNPGFRFNLFVQYKRPEYITRSNGREWDAWEQKYYRYQITSHQQSTLFALHSKANGRASIIYASPAFRTWEDLFKYVENRIVINNSNIATVDRIKAHHKHYTYTSGGNIGKAHSEPEEIESPSLEEIILSAERQERLSLYKHILRTAKIIDEVLIMEEDQESVITNNNSNVSMGRQTKFKLLGLEENEIDQDNIVYAIATIEAFLEIYDLELHLI